jgi:4-amino-4-deoxy-L-arabinose transferase-like glycosyltransferase
MRTAPGRSDRTLLFALLLFALFFRLSTLMMIHTGVDERDYWFSARAIAGGFPYPELSHRTTRFAIILPVALSQVVLGSHPDIYYVLPLLNSLIQTALAFLIGLRLRGRLTGFLAALALILFPYMIRAGSQVRPEIFSITYILLALYCFIEYMEREEKELPSLLWAGALLFVAYEAKITNLFFLPGLLAGVLIFKKKPLHALLLAGEVLMLFLAETGAYAILTKYKLGEFQIIFSHHIEAGTSFVVPRFIDLFRRYSTEKLQLYWQIPFVLFAVASITYLIRGADKRLSLLAIAALSFFAGITFEVAGLNPIAPAEPFINRYFSAVLGPVFLVLACAADEIAVRVFRPARAADAPASVRPYMAALSLGFVSVLILFSLPRLPASIRAYANSPLHPRLHPLVLNETYRREINQAFSRGTSIVAVAGIGGDNAIQTCESYFIDASLYRDGRPPAHTQVGVGESQYLLLSRDDKKTITDTFLAAIRSPFRVLAMPAGSIKDLTEDSVNGERGPADEDANQ